MTSGRTEQFPFSVCHGLSAAGGLSLPVSCASNDGILERRSARSATRCAISESRRVVNDAGRDTPVAIGGAQETLEALGPLPERARLGHGPRGLQPLRNRLGKPAARSCAVAGISLERRWFSWHQRPQADHVLRCGSLE